MLELVVELEQEQELELELLELQVQNHFPDQDLPNQRKIFETLLELSKFLVV